MTKYFYEAFKDSLIFMNARWQFIRNTKTRVVLWIGISVMFGAVFFASNTGYIIRSIAEGNLVQDSALKQYAIVYLQSYMRGELGILVSGTLGLALLSVFISPFTGSVSTSLISSSHIVSVRRDDKHRFTDSIFTQFFSSISLLQLLTLTTVASLLTIEGNNAGGIIFAWMSWPVLIMLSVFFLWVAEYLYRVYGERTRLIAAGSVLAVIGLAILINPRYGETVFGIGEIYSYTIKNFESFDIGQKLMAMGALVILSVIFFIGSYIASMKTLAHPERMKKAKKARRSRWKTSPFYQVEIVKALLLQIWRSTETRKPLIAVTGFGVVILFVTEGSFSIASTLLIIIPLSVSIAWGANLFGVLGQGFSWISSQPKVIDNFVWITYFIQIGITSLIYTIIIVPSLVFLRIPAENISGLILGFIAVNVVMSRSAITKAVHNPYPVRAGTRGEPILPPATLIGYTLRFALWSGQLGTIVLVADNMYLQLGIVFLAVVWSLFRISRLHAKWNTQPELRHRILLTVNNS